MDNGSIHRRPQRLTVNTAKDLVRNSLSYTSMADLDHAIPIRAGKRVKLTSHEEWISASAVLSNTTYSKPRPPSLISINLPTTGISFRRDSGLRMAKASIRSTFKRSYFRFSSRIWSLCKLRNLMHVRVIIDLHSATDTGQGIQKCSVGAGFRSLQKEGFC